MPRGSVSLLPFLLALMGYAIAGLNIWPSLHFALSNASVFVDFSTKCNSSTIRNTTLSLVDTETNSTLLTRTLPDNQSEGRVEFNCSCFLYAGTFRFHLKQTSIITDYRANGTAARETDSTSWWWSSELQVQWPTFHIAVERVGNHSGSFQVGISTNEHFQACSGGFDSALFLEVSYMEYNQIGRNSIDKVRARTRHPIKALRSQSIELSCAFPFTEKDFIRVALRSPHTTQEVKSSGPLYLSRIFSYKLLVDNTNSYRTGCEGTMTVKMVTPPCAHVNGKVLLYQDGGARRGAPGSPAMGAGGAASPGFGSEEPPSPPLAFNWLTQGENETEFNCSVFYPGRNKYCFRFVFNFSRSPSPAQTCLVVYRSAESWGPWQPWSTCSASCGEGVRERLRDCLLPSGVGGMQCTGMVKEQSLCSLEDCAVLPAPSPSPPPASVGATPLGGNLVVVAGISLCLAVILATVLVTVWRKLCRTPQCSSVRRGSVHSPGGRKLSDEASICGHSLQRPSLSDSQGPPGGAGTGLGQKERPPLGSQPLSQPLVLPPSQDPDRLSPTGQKLLPPIFGYRLAQQQLKEMKKKGLKEATLLYHVSSSPVHDTLLETSASPAHSPTPTPTGFAPSGVASGSVPSGLQEDADLSRFRIASPFAEPGPPPQTSRSTPDRLSPRVELMLGPPVSGYGGGGSAKRHDRTADWVEMVERSGLGGLRGGGGGGGDTGVGNSYQKNPNFRRTSSFNDTNPQLPPSAHARQFRERSMTQVASRTLPEGSCRTRGPRESQPFPAFPSYSIPEQGASDWLKSRPHGNDQRKPWVDSAAPYLNSSLKHTGTNTKPVSVAEMHSKGNLNGTRERERQTSGGGGGGTSGIGGPTGWPAGSHGADHLVLDRAERAEQNWNRRGPSPIQRNILARKLKEAQSCSGVSGHRGRQRSSTFSASTSEQRKGRCRSLPMSGEYSSSGGSPYGLSEAEQRMLDLDLSSAYVREEE
ncbi:thrombospondin type-1 domain-containing protein 1 isoform 1-T3 [Polymixia lowei]